MAPFCNCLLNTQRQINDLEIEVSLRMRRLYWRAMYDYVQQAIRGKFDYLFFVDDDIILKAHTIVHLIMSMKPVISGVYVERSGLHRPILIERLSEGCYKQQKVDESKDLQTTDCTGFGCLLLTREVFEQLKGHDFEPENLTPPGHWAVSKAIRKLGYEIYVDLACRVGHLSEKKEVFEYGITEGFTKGGRHV